MADSKRARLVALATASSGNDRRVEVVCSTAGVNDHGARIASGSWDLERYLLNPVVLYAHAARPDAFAGVTVADTLPIGRAENVRVVGDELRAVIVFATAEENPMAEKVYRLFAGGFLNAVSVGFVPRTVQFELVDGCEIAVLSDCELYEISIVPLPSDAGAVAVRNGAELRAYAAANGARAARSGAAAPKVAPPAMSDAELWRSLPNVARAELYAANPERADAMRRAAAAPPSIEALAARPWASLRNMERHRICLERPEVARRLMAAAGINWSGVVVGTTGRRVC